MSRPLRIALLVFIIFRVLFSVWAMVALQINPLPERPDEFLRPYLGQPILTNGVEGLLLGPWQRFDALRYTSIAANGYANEAESVFPPLYPLITSIVSRMLGNGYQAVLLSSILVSNISTILLFGLIIKIGDLQFTPKISTRALVYYAVFPTSFFLFAPYTESLFILCALAAVWQAKNGRFVAAGLLGFLAALTRLTGIVLIVPLVLAWWEFNRHQIWPLQAVLREAKSVTLKELTSSLPLLLPAIGTVLFFVIRNWLGLRPLSEIYQEYWFQTTNFPGSDVFRAMQTMFFGGLSRAGEFTLWIDFLTLLFLAWSTYWVFKRLGPVWGMYNVVLIAFVLLPTSELKPLYSFSRYALAFIPTFWVLAEAGERPLINRLVLYTGFPLLLYLSGQFFVWGWVA